MQASMNHEAMLHKMFKENPRLHYADNSPNPIRSELRLSFESQLQLKPLHSYMDQCRSVLNEIYADIDRFKTDPGNQAILSSITKRLGSFCIDADSWGFNPLYDSAFRLQSLFLEWSGRVWSNRLWKALKREMARVFFQVERCESDFRRRLAV
jgi:hypothetical protein